MDPIITALAAGATFLLKGVAGEAVQDAYRALKELLGGKVSSLANLEEDPADDDYLKATAKEIRRKGLADDPNVLAKAAELLKASEQELAVIPGDSAIDISSLRAAHNVIIKRVHTAGELHLKDLTAHGGTIDIQDISAGTLRKN